MLSEAAIRKNIELSNIYVNKTSNKIYKQDDIIFMPKLARTLEIISEKNITAFYHDGELTRLIIEEINENGILFFNISIGIALFKIRIMFMKIQYLKRWKCKFRGFHKLQSLSRITY